MSSHKLETLHRIFLSTREQMALWGQYLNTPQQCSFSVQL